MPMICIADLDHELMQSKKCIMQFQHYEKRYNLPKDSLYSISLQETRKKHSKFDIYIVWPWTVNVEGVGHHFTTKAAAVNFTKNQLEQGKKSIDVGCMQVNLKYHPDAFKSINQAFSPKSNIEYASKLLKEKYNKHHNWHKAIGGYHSESEDRGRKYSDDVRRIASKITAHKEQLRQYTYSKKYNKTIRSPSLDEDVVRGAQRRSNRLATASPQKADYGLKDNRSSDMFRVSTSAKKKYNSFRARKIDSHIFEVND